MLPPSLSPLANHLWQSTVFTAAVVLLTLTLRRNHAQARYRLWLAASVKFLIPFSLLVSAGSQLGWRTTPAPPSSLAVSMSEAMDQISQPFTPPPSLGDSRRAPTTAFPMAPAIMGVWLCGCAVVVGRWWLRWRRIRAAVRAASPLDLAAPIPVMSSPALLEPGVFGVIRPVLLLPEGIADRLTPAQLEAILAHELCHVRRRDNLASAIHMLVEAGFWFHPVVWWIGARLIDERERACDEEVLRLGSEPAVYAEGILNVCKFYLESPLACASGVTGSDLRKRIEAIMNNSISHNLTRARKLLLATAGIAAVAGPIAIGIVNAPQSRAQSSPAAAEPATFEVASIKPASPDAQGVQIRLLPGGGIGMTNVTLRAMITFAYDVRDFQVSGGPGWLGSERYDIQAKSERTEAPPEGEMRRMTDDQRRAVADLVRQRLRALLAERFQLTIHKETKELPVYALVVGKNGHKMQESKEGQTGMRNIRIGRGELNAQGAQMQMLTNSLSNITGRPVIDKTGLTGIYDLKLQWTPDPGQGRGGPFGGAGGPPGDRPEPSSAELSGPSIFTAVQEQLGLKLEAQKGPVEIIVIDRAEKASAN